MVSRVSVPTTGRRAPRDRHEVFLGFDTEFHPVSRELLSVQLAGGVDGRVVSEVYEPTSPRLSPASLLAYVRVFLKSFCIPAKPVNGLHRVTLISHFNAAELGTFEDPIRDLSIRRIGRAHHAQTDVLLAEDGRWRLTLLDLFGYFRTSLKTLGEYLQLPKLDVDVAHIAHVKAGNPHLFRAYALRDAEIPYVAYTGFRREVLDKYGVDVAFNISLPSVAADIFRFNHFKVPPSPYTTIYEPTRRKKRNGEWTDGRRAVHLFDGIRDARVEHIRGLHGGRAEAFIQGLYDAPVAERDVTSMYPACAILQPLPEARTRMRRVTAVGDLMELEGVGLFEFRFPPEAVYPCMPVRQLGRDRLLFPGTGVSYSSFAEAREALSLGAELVVVSAHGFEPASRERDHDVGRFIRAVWNEKLTAPSGSLQATIWKEVLNASLGKLAQRTSPSNLIDIEREARQAGLGGAGALLAANPSLRTSLQGAPTLGSLWSPERLALITGRARALMSQIIVRSKALLVSTDAVIYDASAPFDCDAVRQLQAVGSDLKLVRSADAAVVIRSRMYALLRRAGNVQPGERAIAADDTWAVIKVARQGTGEPEESFANTLLANLRAGSNVAATWSRTRLLSVDEAIRRGARIGDAVTQEGVTRFRWDGKRRLADRDCQIFRRYTTTTPYRSERRMEGSARAVLVRTGQARRQQRPLSPGKRQRITDLLRAGAGVRDVARQLKVAASTVSAIRAGLGLGTEGGTP